ncbi:MAG: hypothetical protein ABL894_13980 [Hyphomicrobium sp.]
MLRYRFAVLALAVSLMPSATASAQDSYTTRIEPRPVYGATTTIEHGVRVIRPIPPVRQVIINPGSLTPLNLGTHEYYNGRPYPWPN